MKNYLLNILEKTDRYVFSNISTLEFIKKLYFINLLLFSHEIKTGDTIALHLQKSITWIVVYIASLLKGCKLLIIPPNIKQSELYYYLTITNTKVLFSTEESLINIKKLPFLRVVYLLDDYEELHYKIGRKHHKNIAKSIEHLTYHPDICLDDLHDILKDLYNDRFRNKETGIITPTSGVDGPPKLVFINANALLNIIKKTKRVIPFNITDTVYSNIEFFHSHIMTVLLPFANMCTFVGSQKKANIVIEDTLSFNVMWENKIQTLLENRIIGKILQKKYLNWLLTLLYKKRLHKYYLKNTNLKSLVIYNNTINHTPLEIIKQSNLPVFSTYGSQEMCQFVAWNDYSTKQLKQKGCLGYFIPGIQWITENNYLLLTSNTMFKKYWDHPFYKKELLLNDYEFFNTLDKVIENGDMVLFKGRSSKVINSTTKENIYGDYLEKILLDLPYVKELTTFSNNDQLTIMIYPNIKIMETENISLQFLDDILIHYEQNLESYYNRKIRIILSSVPFVKTPEGKIKSYLYQH